MPESELCPETVPAAAWSNYLPSHIKALIGKNKGTSESWGCCWNRPARALPTRGRLGVWRRGYLRLRGSQWFWGNLLVGKPPLEMVQWHSESLTSVHPLHLHVSLLTSRWKTSRALLLPTAGNPSPTVPPPSRAQHHSSNNDLLAWQNSPWKSQVIPPHTPSLMPSRSPIAQSHR